ncbi:MAG: hypothetical protein HEQ40_00845 [Lacibacter sp.]|jgi:hypothetical protein
MNHHYQKIDNFYDIYDLPAARKMLTRSMKAACAEQVWEQLPANVLFFTEQLTILSKAAIKIIENHDFINEVEIEPGTDNGVWMLNQYALYCGWCKYRTPWDYFPRHLSKKEFLDPYAALQKFSAYHNSAEWKKVIANIRYYALSHESIFEVIPKTCFIGTWNQLHKLLEATHLIEVRQSTPQPKPRRKWQSPDSEPVKNENNSVS